MVGGAPAVLMVVLVALMPSSPRRLLSLGRDQEAEHALRWLRGRSYPVGTELQAVQVRPGVLVRDALVRDALIRDTLVRDILARDVLVRDVLVRDALVRGFTSSEGTAGGRQLVKA